jgi:alpha-beta hydrolase superfamily lysophospholipase
MIPRALKGSIKWDAWNGVQKVIVMTFSENGIGQKEYHVVFVCHSLGGLIAKQIVVTRHDQFSKTERV